MRRTLILCLAIFSAACGSSSSDNKKTTNIGLNNMTDTSSCRGDTPAGSTPYGVWAINYGGQSGAISGGIKMTFDIESSFVTVTNYCDFGGGASSTSVTVPASVTDSEVKFLSSGSNKSSGSTTCSVSVSAASANFKLVGNCLALSKDGKMVLMVREGNAPVSSSPITNSQTNNFSNMPTGMPSSQSLDMPTMPTMPRMPSIPNLPNEPQDP